MTLSMKPLSAHTGIEVRGVDLSKPIEDSVRATLNHAFSTHSVLVVRDQKLSPEQLLAAVQLFGEIFVQHNTRFALPDCPQIHYISNQDKYPDGRRYIPGEGYHTDHSNDRIPPKATVLHAVTLPSKGGDTQFVNMQRAYDTLPEDVQRRIDGLQGVHVYQSRHSERKLYGLTEQRKQEIADQVIHPIVRTHPENGRKSIYINPIRIDEIVGLGDAETVPLLTQLLDHAVKPEHQYRHKWQEGDFVMWDNRCLLHKANGDYDMDEMRYLYRVMLQGDTPR